MCFWRKDSIILLAILVLGKIAGKVFSVVFLEVALSLRDAFLTAGHRMQEECARLGITEDELVLDFRRWREARRVAQEGVEYKGNAGQPLSFPWIVAVPCFRPVFSGRFFDAKLPHPNRHLKQALAHHARRPT